MCVLCISICHLYNSIAGSVPQAASAKEHLQAYAAAQQRMSAAQAHFQHHYPSSGSSSRHSNPHVAAAAQLAARAPPNVTVHPGYNDLSVNKMREVWFFRYMPFTMVRWMDSQGIEVKH